MVDVRAITLHQPWASLVAVGAKTIEARGWPTSYRGRLLIHAGLRRADKGRVGDSDWCVHRYVGDVNPNWPPEESLDRLKDWTGFVDMRQLLDGDRGHPLHIGAVVASCVLDDCVPIDRHAHGPHVGDFPHDGPLPHQQGGLWLIGPRADCPLRVEEQRPFGDFTPGRFAWLLSDVKPTTERCPRCWGEPLATRTRRFNDQCGVYGYMSKAGRTGADRHPDRCTCQNETTPHKHYNSAPYSCARCLECEGYTPALVTECSTCASTGSCDPVPMRGAQRLWTPKWG